MREKLRAVRLLALDVDGTLTDGGIFYDDAGRELKRFHIHDGLGLVLAGLAGLTVVWITGRNSPIVQRRAKELQVALVMEGVRDKGAALQEAAQTFGVSLAECAFMGDDLNDLLGFAVAGVGFAPANACADVLALADWVAPHRGGDGAVRDVVELLLQSRGDWDTVLAAYLKSLVSPAAANPTQ